MKTVYALLIITMITGVAFAKDVQVKSHYRDTDGDGIKETYVNSYTRTAPDNSTQNNYGTEGNFNPYNGKSGTIDPYKSTNTNQNSDQYKSFYNR